ncbi:MAG: glycosyltransferase [Bryobacterales bacterium]|nr:glycosyltransferase [Bryobacteraceae bacterium]MDW8354832.1 glycosyltransferase [Bryobacterales bacterium]
MEPTETPSRISVVIAARNRAGALRRCLTALERSAARERIEILVVDRGSSDDSPQLDAEFPSVNLLRLPRDFGAVKALNIGMRTATGDFVLLLEPDVEVLPDTVACLAEKLEAAPEAAAVCPLAITEQQEPVSRQRPVPSPDELYRSWRAGGFPDWEPVRLDKDAVPVEYVDHWTPLLVRMTFLKGMRYVDERYGNFGWKLEICCQIRRAGKRILLVPGVRVRIHPGWEETAVPAARRALLAADEALGVALFARKHYGWPAGLRLRALTLLAGLGDVFSALLRLRDVAFAVHKARFLLAGQKLDGSQRFE